MKPEKLGMISAKLDELEREISGFGCVTRNGYVVRDWGHPNTPVYQGSAVKPVIAFFVWKAVQDGLIPSLDAPVSDFEPALNAINPQLGHKDARITWRQMIQQTACYGQTEEPGTAFDYNDFAMSLLWKTLFTKVYKQKPEDVTAKVLMPQLGSVIGFEDAAQFVAFEGEPHIGHFMISARDFCRFGLLYLHHSKWKDRQIISPTTAKASVSTPLPLTLPRTRGVKSEMLPDPQDMGGGANQEWHCGSYSYLWWTNGVDEKGVRLWPDAPPDTFGAIGWGGHTGMVVIPSLGIVASWAKSSLPCTAMSADGRKNMNQVLKILKDSVEN